MTNAFKEPTGVLGKKILLGQLAARGDCLYATTVARQIKHDYPDCHLTWAVGTMCASLLTNNPYVDQIWEIPVDDHAGVKDAWLQFEKQANEYKNNGVFDEIFLTQIYPNNFQNYDGTVRSSIFRGYPNPITVPVSPVIYLTDEEVFNANKFIEKHQIQNYSNVILFEFAYKSGQSFLTKDFALTVATKLVNENPDLAIILSSHEPINTGHPAIIDGSPLSFRENAEITKYCDLLVGCSSGITWLCTSEWAKSLPMIQLLKKDCSVFASVTHDFNYFGLDASQVIEITDCSEQHIVNCIMTFFNENLSVAHQNYHEHINLNFNHYFSTFDLDFKTADQMEKYYLSIFNTYKRYGSEFRPHLHAHLQDCLIQRKALQRTNRPLKKQILDKIFRKWKKPIHDYLMQRKALQHSNRPLKKQILDRVFRKWKKN
jgi:hypothetical protein